MTAATVNSNRSTMGRVAVLAACLLAGSLGVAQAATPVTDFPQIAVSYSDLDLASSEGNRELYKRIANAAREVCPYPNARSLSEVEVNHSCREAAIAKAVRQINSPALVALRAERVKRG
jgi:UrcA family protein